MYQSDIYEYLLEVKNNTILVCNNDKEAIATRDVALLLGYDTFILPDIRVNTGEDLRAYREDIREVFCLLARYYALGSEAKKILVSPIRTLLLPLPKADYFDSIELEFGDEIDLDELKSRLYDWGYHFVDIATSQGEVSFRGDIIDIYPSCSDRPYRVSLFDNEVESIQTYNEDSQKRDKDELESIMIGPGFLSLDSNEYKNLIEEIESSEHDALVKDLDSLGLWHLGSKGEYLLNLLDGVSVSNIDDSIKEAIEDSNAANKRKHTQKFRSISTR